MLSNNVSKIYYQIDDSAEQEYTSPVTLPKGNYNFKYYGVDSNGIKGVARTKEFKIDTDIGNNFSITKASRDKTYKASYYIAGSVVEPDVKKIVINNNQFLQFIGENWTKSVDLSLGKNSFEIKAEDFAGNQSAGQTVEITRLKMADPNNDSRIDIKDFSVLMNSWGNNNNYLADFNEDSQINIADFSILMSNWGK